MNTKQRNKLIITSIVVLIVFTLLIAFLSPWKAIAAAVTLVFLFVVFLRPLWVLGFLAVYIPFEPFILKFTPDEIYVYARYFSESLIYLLVVSVLLIILKERERFRKTPLDLPFIIFLCLLLISTIVNFVHPWDAALGIRQIIRFILVAYLVVYLFPPVNWIKKVTAVMFAVVALQSILGLSQAVIGAPMDNLLLPTERKSFGDIELTSGVEQFWEPGERVFATMGRYDQLGTFLAFFLLLSVGLVYQKKIRQNYRELWWVLVLALPALVLTYSRSSWFGFLLGFLFIGLYVLRSRRVIAAVILFAIATTAYLGFSGITVQHLTEIPGGQTVVERFYESFSYDRWVSEYYGLGRLFWIIHTPLTVVPASPLFGFGPSQYGGGAAAALGNSGVYEQLGLPFGVYGTSGIVDNNWFSLWGEAGTLGLIVYLWMYIGLFAFSYRLYKKSKDNFTKGLSLGFCAAMIAVALNAFLATFLEVRTLAFYLWMYGGFIIVLAYRESNNSKKLKGEKHEGPRNK